MENQENKQPLTSPSEIGKLMEKKQQIENQQQQQVVSQPQEDGGNTPTTDTPQTPVSDQSMEKPVLVHDDQAEAPIKGVIITKEQMEAVSSNQVVPGSLPPSTLDATSRYLANMEDDFKAFPEIMSQMSVNQNIVDGGVQFVPPSELTPEQLQQQQQMLQQQQNQAQLQQPPVTQPPAVQQLPQYQQQAQERHRIESDAIMKGMDEKNPELAVVLIDKIGMGGLMGSFTEEERSKLEVARRIRVEEVETVQLKTIKKKKAKGKNVDQILQRRSSPFMSHVVAPVSGYLAVMSGCSSFEVLALMEDSGNAIMNMEKRWTLIFDKLVSSSIGITKNRNNPKDKDDTEGFNEFLRKTSPLDYDNFIFGILCATHPDKDKLEINCANEKCPGKKFEYEYTVKSIIRFERMSAKLLELIKGAVDNSHSSSFAAMYSETAPLNIVIAFKLPESGFVIELGLESAFDFIYKSIKQISEDIDPKYQQAAVLSSTVLAVNVPDPDQDPADAAIEVEYIEHDDREDISKLIYSLSETDLKILANKNEKLIDGLTMEYGLTNVKCPHCNHMREYIPIENVEDLLFLRHHRAMSSTLE